jgi:hypothetical protein
MKTLKTKKLYIAICWSFLKNVPPAKYPKIDEIEKTPKILEVLKEAVPEYSEIIEAREELTKDYLPNTQITDKAEIEAITDINTKQLRQENKYEKQVDTIEFEDDYFNTFFQQFERWGKDWFRKIDSFIEFRKDMNETNKQPKGKLIKK